MEMEEVTHTFCSLKKVNKECIGFFAQVLLLYIVVVTSIVNLSLNAGNATLWTALLSSCLGYILPAPKLSKPKLTLTPTSSTANSVINERI